MYRLDELTQILYEISMTIGTHLGFERMLRNVALATLRKFNSTAFVVFEERQDSGRCQYERAYVTPYVFPRSDLYAELEKRLPRAAVLDELETFQRTLPIQISLEGQYCYHLMTLPGYGLLALFRAHGFLPSHVIESLVPITKKLAVACQACLSHEKLKVSEERLQFVLEGSQLGYWDWNIETGEVRRNSRWAEMLGYTLQEVEFTVKQWADLHHPEDRAAVWQSIQDHVEGKTSAHQLEYRMRTKDGQYKWILDQAKIVSRDPQGSPIRMCGTHTEYYRA